MKQDDIPWQTLDSKVVYENPWMKVYEDTFRTSTGYEGIYGFVEGKPGLFIVALTNDEDVYLIESFRYPTKKWQWELPTGGIDKGRSPLESARHELAEELGMTADTWTHINTYEPTHNGLMKDYQYVFLAEGLHFGAAHHEKAEAIRSVKAVSFKELMA